jgi:hypothetical protein
MTQATTTLTRAETDDYKTEPEPDAKQLILLGFLPDSSESVYKSRSAFFIHEAYQGRAA